MAKRAMHIFVALLVAILSFCNAEVEARTSSNIKTIRFDNVTTHYIMLGNPLKNESRDLNSLIQNAHKQYITVVKQGSNGILEIKLDYRYENSSHFIWPFNNPTQILTVVCLVLFYLYLIGVISLQRKVIQESCQTLQELLTPLLEQQGGNGNHINLEVVDRFVNRRLIGQINERISSGFEAVEVLVKLRPTDRTLRQNQRRQTGGHDNDARQHFPPYPVYEIET